MTVRRMRSARAVWAAALALSLAVLAGCVSVPTAGPLEKVEGRQLGCQNCVNVAVAAPAPGDDPKQIVEGYLRATSNYQPNYSVAKKYLTKTAAEKWSPEAGAWIYDGAPTADGDKVTLEGLLIGVLDGNRSYTAKDTKLRGVDFGLVKEDGEWRISTPPRGLLVAAYSFSRFYQPYSLYFIGNGNTLVPDPIYLPSLRSQSNIASVLVKALLHGPSPWLKPATTTAIPGTAALSGDAVTIEDGIATVPLNAPVMELNDQQRLLMAAQVIYTLREAVGVKGVLFTVNQQPLRVPGGDDTTFVVSADSVPHELDPIPFVAGDQLYAVHEGALKRVSANSAAPTLENLRTDLGHGRYPIDSVAVAPANTDIAVVTNGRSRLRRGPTAAAQVVALLDGASELLRPQFSRYGELWAVGRRDGRQRMWMITADGEVEVAAPGLLGTGRITAFKVSPDGARMALIREIDGNTVLGLARINRRGKITVDGWQQLNLTQQAQPQLSRLQDLSWVDATDLLVLGAASKTASLQPFRISQDASRIISEGESTNWDPVELTVLLGSQAAIVIGRNGQTYRDEGNQWAPYLDTTVSTIAYPG
jgi:hypothetical protein